MRHLCRRSDAPSRRAADALLPILVVLLLALTACQQTKRSDPPPNSLYIAVAGPMSGQYEAFGNQMRLGAEAAVDRLNGAGGVLGRQIRLEALDDRCDPRRATRMAKDVTTEGVLFVDGHFCSGTSIPASAVYDRAGVVMISPASTNPALTDQGRALVFRVVRSDADQARFAADHVLDRQLSAHIGTVHDNSAYGRLLVAAFTERVRQRGGAIAGAYSIHPGAKDYPSLIASLRTDGVGLVYFGGYAPEAAAIARGAARAGVSIQLVGADALVDRSFWREAGPAGEGTLMPFIADPRQAPAARDVVASLERAGVDPKGYVLFSYAAVQVWAQAAERSGGTAGASVANALRSATFPTVLGELAFDGRGDVVGGPPWEMLRWSAGRYAPVGRWLPGMWTQGDDTRSGSAPSRTAS